MSFKLILIIGIHLLCSCRSIKRMTNKNVESDFLQTKPKTKNEIIFSRKMVKIKHLLKGVKTKLS